MARQVSRSKPKLSKRLKERVVPARQWAFAVLGRLFPSLMGAYAYRIWFATYRFPMPAREIRWLKSSNEKQLATGDLQVMTYRWGQPEHPAVLLVHGWNGRGSQMAAFAKPLVDAGYYVVAFDAPGHGKSPGDRTNIFEFQQVMNALRDELGELHAIVAHSFGTMASVLSLSQGLAANKVVCLGAPATMAFLVDSFCSFMKITGKTKENLEQRIRAKLNGYSIQQLSADYNSTHLGHVKALIIHDQDDPYVPVSQSELLHSRWPNSRLLITNALGHQRILSDKHILKQVSSFITDEA